MEDHELSARYRLTAEPPSPSARRLLNIILKPSEGILLLASGILAGVGIAILINAVPVPSAWLGYVLTVGGVAGMVLQSFDAWRRAKRETLSEWNSRWAEFGDRQDLHR